MIFKTVKLNTINFLTIEIEETFNNNFSVLAYDQENEIFIEEFTNNYNTAVLIAENLINQISKQY